MKRARELARDVNGWCSEAELELQSGCRRTRFRHRTRAPAQVVIPSSACRTGCVSRREISHRASQNRRYVPVDITPSRWTESRSRRLPFEVQIDQPPDHSRCRRVAVARGQGAELGARASTQRCEHRPRHPDRDLGLVRSGLALRHTGVSRSSSPPIRNSSIQQTTIKPGICTSFSDGATKCCGDNGLVEAIERHVAVQTAALLVPSFSTTNAPDLRASVPRSDLGMARFPQRARVRDRRGDERRPMGRSRRRDRSSDDVDPFAVLSSEPT